MSKRDTKDIIIAVRESSREKGDKVCDKLMKGSMGPYFTSQDAYWKPYKRINALPPQGYKEFCYHGNRLLLMLPYIKAAGEKTWKHMKDGSEIGVDTLLRNTELKSEIEEKDNGESGLIIYYGFESSIIRYDTKKRLWVISIEHKPHIMAECGSEFSTLILGNYDWL